MAYDAIIFDMDGVLLTGTGTTPETYRNATEAMLHAFGIDEADEWSMDLEDPDSIDAFREACAGWEIPPDPAWGYRERVSTEIACESIEAGEKRAHEDAHVLQSLARDYPVGIVSNNRFDTVKFCSAKFGWEQCVSIHRGRFPTLGDFSKRKPDPTYLRWAMERLDNESPLFVGDRITDVETAERVGCDGVLLSRNGLRQPETPVPTYEIESLEELPSLSDAGWPSGTV